MVMIISSCGILTSPSILFMILVILVYDISDIIRYDISLRYSVQTFGCKFGITLDFA